MERVGYVTHEEAVRSLATSHLILVILDDTPGVERMYPAKTFEAMAIGRPTLVLAPHDSALAQLVRLHAVGDLLPPRDEGRICDYLIAKLKEFRDGSRETPVAKPVDIERFDRRQTAGEFARVMRDAIRRRRPS